MQIGGQTEREELQFFLHVFDAAAHEALDGVNRTLGSLDQIFPGRTADNDLVVFAQGDHGRYEIEAILSRDHDGGIPLHESHQRIGGPEIDSDDAFVSHSKFVVLRSLVKLAFSSWRVLPGSAH